MGKYIRKPKLTGDVVAVLDVSHGVRTRAALQKLQATPSPEHHRELSYLQLRSRKLEKPPLPQLTCRKQQNPNPSSGTLKLAIRASGSGSDGPGLNNKGVGAPSEFEIKPEGETEEASFGENNYDLDARERSTRESTPCSFTRESNDSTTPGSSTRTIVPNSVQRIMPSTEEIEEFFARHTQEQQRLFTEKYNFDIVNEKPIQGRYEWVRVQP